MPDILPPWPLLLAFFAASGALALTPGPGVLFIVTQSLVHGRRSGLASVAGVALGNLGNAVAVSLGLAALLGSSALAFTLVKWAGALYLIYLGVRLWLAPGAPAAPPLPQSAALARIGRDAFIVALLNPKTALFFAAFLPQFMSDAGPARAQALLLSSLFVAIAASTDTVYALAASGASRALAGLGLGRACRRLAGVSLVGLGLLAALSSARR